jgi:hypothetical protein
VSSSSPVVQQVGIYAVATTTRQGVYGIGPHAETTWFVPGDGRVQAAGGESPIAVQDGADADDWNTTVFSASDGTVIKPAVDGNGKLHTTVVYQGGFAAVVEVDDKPVGVRFFDDTGRQLGGAEGSLSADPPGLPVVVPPSGSGSEVFSPTGGKLLDLPNSASGSHLVGTTLFVNEGGTDSFPKWREYDLKTGSKGPVCDFAMPAFVGSDGSVLVFDVTNRKAEVLARARDLATCEVVWSLPSAPGSLGRVWQINTTLVQLSDDGTELMSLVAPS